MGVLKCYQMDAAAVRLRGFLERVETLLTHDEDPQVVTNCLHALDQVCLAVVVQREQGARFQAAG